MPSVRHFLFALAALLPASLVHAALPKPSLAPEAPSLRGHLLIASPRIGDARFARTVILIVRHGKDGAFGLIINRPVGERSLAMLLGSASPIGKGAGTLRIFAGGPVQPEAGFVVHTSDYKRQGTIDVNAETAVTASPEVLRDMAHNNGPQKALVVFGYAGWAPNQLEGELARDDWLVTPADSALVFDAARDRVWDEAMARRSREP